MRTSHGYRARRIAAATIVVAALTALLPVRVTAVDFTVPTSLTPQVEFWVNIFSRYGKRQVVIHDTEHLDRVYTVLDLSDLDSAGLSEMQIELALKAEEIAVKDRVRSVLRRLGTIDPSRDYMTDEERQIAALFGDNPSPSAFIAAAGEGRLRGQRGLRERFGRGLQVAHAYFPSMERIFTQEGVPLEITRLPLVESCFNLRAYSKVGAAGVWQFMPATARRFMRVDNNVDERLDPLVSTRAAAQFMRENYERLGSWPLAIKAYNHGPGGIARAIRETGTTDAATIIQRYRGPAYKFASRNFYPEFLAALHVERNYRAYFGDLPLDPPLTAESIQLTRQTSMNAAARCAGTESWELASLNPSLLDAIHTGRRPIPSGYELRLPRGTRERFHTCVAGLPAAPSQRATRSTTANRGRAAASQASAKRRTHVVHKVRRGQTLGQIANLYGCSVDQIRRGNRLKGNTIRAGQVLRIPVS